MFLFKLELETRFPGWYTRMVLQNNLTYQLVWPVQNVSKVEETIEIYGGQITFSTQLIKPI